ncbi:alpha/beta hydrolase family protein [Thiohalophilus sp.]|uniref:alpha/beta hydrolase family protein n=1 Tax=Thiohalophilus sp. TaxID=3028392 RepID=UPI003974990E
MSFAQRGLWHRDRRGRGKWLFVALLIIIVVSPLVWLGWPVRGDPSERFIDRRGEVEQVQITRQWQTDESRYKHLTLTSSSELQVEMTVRRPRTDNGERPLMLLLGGAGTGRQAAELVQDTGDMVVAAISYPYQGPEDLAGWEVLWHFDEIQRAILDTTPALLLALDYLARQSYVDSERMELVGVSLGAFFAGTAGALEERFRRVWLVQGAADPRAVYEYRLRKQITFEPARVLVAGILGVLTASEDLKPERWLGKIAPRPVVVISSRGDNAYPPASVVALHGALREPYELEWLAGEHVTPGRPRILKQLNERVVQRIAAEEKRGDMPSP